jgi:hypothetical protein
MQILARIERRKAVELELRKNRPWQPKGQENGVVSNFVTDILQDNANLQLGIMELRDMLQRSNDEVERLREQGMLSPSTSEAPDQGQSQGPNLGTELGASREIHVHHHYHPPQRSSSEIKPSKAANTRRRAKRKSTASISHTPRSSISLGRPPTPSSSSAILSQTSASIPTRGSKRWSVQSAQTGFTTTSSLPSSPYEDSIFDRVFGDNATEISRPSSPDSTIFSPHNVNGFMGFETSKQEFPFDNLSSVSTDMFQRSVSESGRLPPSIYRGNRAPARDSINQDHDVFSTHSIILEENEDLESSHHHSTPKSRVEVNQFNSSATVIGRTIRRSNSHESLISIHGMDIHTLSSRPSQLFLGKYVSTAVPSSSVSATVTGESALGTRASPPRLRPQNQGSRSASQTYLSDIAEQQGRALNRKSSRPSLPGRVSGWVWSKWSNGTSAP